MNSYETNPPLESKGPRSEQEKERAAEYFSHAFDTLNEDNKRGVPVLLMYMQFDRATNGELLSDAFEAIGEKIYKEERYTGPAGLDRRAETLFWIIDHDNKLVGKNLTVSDAQLILKEKGYDGVRLDGQQYERAKYKKKEEQ